MLFHACLFTLLLFFISEGAAQIRNSNWAAEESSVCIESGILDINNLGFKLLNTAVSQPGNVILAPIGAAWSLGILYLVSANQTAQQIFKLLARSGEVKMNPTKVEEELADLFQSLRESESKFATSNQVLLKSCNDINEEFKNTLLKSNLAEVKFESTSKIELFNETEGFNKTENETQSRSLDVPELPNIELVNLVAFNDSWKVQFVPDKTVRDYFYSGKRETTEVWMMSMESETFKFYEDLEMQYKFIELPYEKGHRSMIMALPTQYDQPASLQLDTQSYCKIKAKMMPTKLDMVSFPKFHFEEVNSIKDILISVGLEDVSNETTAELPGLCTEDEGVYVSDIKQIISIEVDEDGGESASVTKLKFKPVAFRGVKEFIANHPFTFYIEDRNTGTILLSGRIDEPSESISFSEALHF